MEDFTRAVGFAAALEDAIAAEVRPWAGGTAVLDPGLPDTWDLNFLRLEEPWGGDPAAFVESAGVLRPAGLRARRDGQPVPAELRASAAHSPSTRRSRSLRPRAAKAVAISSASPASRPEATRA